jgi:hypothetical protein
LPPPMGSIDPASTSLCAATLGSTLASGRPRPEGAV